MEVIIIKGDYIYTLVNVERPEKYKAKALGYSGFAIKKIEKINQKSKSHENR